MTGLRQAVSRLGTRPKSVVPALVVAAFGCGLAGVFWLGLPLWTLLVPALAVGYALTVLQNPTAGLFVVICIFFLPLQLGGLTLLQVVGVTTSGLILFWFLTRHHAIRLGNVFYPLVVFGVLILVSFYFTRDPGRTAFFARKWVFNMAFLLLMTNLVMRFEALKRVIWAIILMAAVNALVGVADFATSSQMKYRSAGLLENENEFGRLAALAFPLALYQFLYRRGRGRWLGLVLSALLAGGVISSVSRGAFLALSVTFTTILIIERRRWRPLLAVVILGLMATPFLPAYFYDRVDTLVRDIQGTLPLAEQEKLTTRGYYNKGGMKMWLANPILGVGIGNFGYYFVEPEFNPGMRASINLPAHNIYLQALAEMGIVGLAVLLWIISLTFRNLLIARRESTDSEDRWLYSGGVQMMALTVFVASFSSGNLMGEDLWLLIGLAVAARQAVERREVQREPGEVTSSLVPSAVG